MFESCHPDQELVSKALSRGPFYLPARGAFEFRVATHYPASNQQLCYRIQRRQYDFFLTPSPGS